jgi:Leucine-rich repeat (LRR) protein
MMRKLLSALLLFLLACSVVSAQDEPTPYEIALQRIEEARVSGATELDLSELGLTELPPEIGSLHKLESLDLFGNQLSSIPPEIGNLHNLTWLMLSANSLESLPKEIGQLTNLTLLYLHENKLSSIPPEIANLQNLCSLTLSDNQLVELPVELGQLKLLENSEGCKNRIGYYWVLSVDNNPLISPPPEVVEQGTAAILDYLRNEAWWHLQRLIAGGATFTGILAATVLGLRWKNRRGNRKKKNEEIST